MYYVRYVLFDYLFAKILTVSGNTGIEVDYDHKPILIKYFFDFLRRL